MSSGPVGPAAASHTEGEGFLPVVAPRDHQTQEEEADVAHSLLWNIWRPKEYRPNLIFLWNVLELVILTCPKVNHGPEEAARSEHAGFESQIFLPLALPRIFSKTRGGEKADRTVFSQNKNDSPASLENNFSSCLDVSRESLPLLPSAARPRPQLGCISLGSGRHLGVPTRFVLQVAKIQHSQGLEGQVPNPGAGQRPKGSSSSGPPLLEAALALRTGLPGLGCVGDGPRRPPPPQTTPPGAGTDPASPAPSAA